MQMETALNHVHAARRFFGLESTRESMKIFADMLRKNGGYDAEELRALRDWVVNVRFKGRIFTNTEEILAYGQPVLHGDRTSSRRSSRPRTGRNWTRAWPSTSSSAII